MGLYLFVSIIGFFCFGFSILRVLQHESFYFFLFFELFFRFLDLISRQF